MLRRNQSVIILALLALAIVALVLIGPMLPARGAGDAASSIVIPLNSDQQPAATEIPPQPTATFPTATAPDSPPPDVILQPSDEGPGVLADQVLVPEDDNPDVSPAAPEGWNPPALPVPLALHPFDHFLFARPVGADRNNFALDYYPYASDGPANDLRIHHGIDLSNDVGVEVYAAGSGVVSWAGKGHFNEETRQAITAYGNTVVIEHDFGYEGRPLYTLYAHLSVILVTQGQYVEMGDTIGLIGNTGLTTGPHVHFEVRLGRDAYNDVRNPVLWMAPYAGTGPVAGRLELDGETLQDAPITLTDVTTGLIAYRTTTYAGVSAPSDDNWNENFVFADVRIGRYLAEARLGQYRWEAVVDVQEGVTNWVEFELVDDDLPTPTPTVDTP
ncbi:MAG: peptidoglycan DD-metalloendopeptidase family protein [Chloroflexi bacterium]|nr:peptidoglycan DD-metalloendopeptidase family protein [Chloroflexota bacterium]